MRLQYLIFIIERYLYQKLNEEYLHNIVIFLVN